MIKALSAGLALVWFIAAGYTLVAQHQYPYWHSGVMMAALMFYALADATEE